MFSEEFRFAQIGLAIFHLRVALPILYLVLYILTLKYTTFAFAGLCLNLGGDLRSRAARIHVVERLRLRLLNATTLSRTPLLLTYTLNLEFYGRGRPSPSYPMHSPLTSGVDHVSTWPGMARGAKKFGACAKTLPRPDFSRTQPFSASLLAVAGLRLCFRGRAPSRRQSGAEQPHLQANSALAPDGTPGLTARRTWA